LPVARILIRSPGREQHKISEHKASRNDQRSNLLNLLNPHATTLML
jgi:hypothetical protein